MNDKTETWNSFPGVMKGTAVPFKVIRRTGFAGSRRFFAKVIPLAAICFHDLLV